MATETKAATCTCNGDWSGIQPTDKCRHPETCCYLHCLYCRALGIWPEQEGGLSVQEPSGVAKGITGRVKG